jgi:hypothetical protein
LLIISKREPFKSWQGSRFQATLYPPAEREREKKNGKGRRERERRETGTRGHVIVIMIPVYYGRHGRFDSSFSQGIVQSEEPEQASGVALERLAEGIRQTHRFLLYAKKDTPRKP